MNIGIDEKRFCLRLRGALGQRHGLGRGGCFIEQRGVGDVEPGEVADHGLEVEQRFQPALADLGLIRRIGRVPGRVLQNVALDHRRQDGAVIALADQRGEHLVLRCELAHMRQRLGLAERAARDRAAPSGGSRTAASGPSARRGCSRRRCSASHDVAGRGADMPAHEIGGGFSGGLERRVHGNFVVAYRSYSAEAGSVAGCGEWTEGCGVLGRRVKAAMTAVWVACFLKPYVPCRRPHPSGRRVRSCPQSSA